MSDLTPTQIYFETREFCHRDAYKHLSNLRRAFFELKLKTKRTLHENNLFWEQEVESAKIEKDKEWLKMYQLLEAENEKLKEKLQNLSTSSTEATCNSDLPLWEAEQKINEMSRKLDEKQILISKLQIALADQTKKMFELEKSNFMLHLQYMSAIQKKSKLFKELLKNNNDNRKLSCPN